MGQLHVDFLMPSINTMKKKCVLLLFLCVEISLSAQFIYHDASSFPLLGKAAEETETRYERLPLSLKNRTREAVWSLGKMTAGLALRFNTNSTAISLRWDLFQDFFMNHMAMTGIKGFDLYSLEGDKWVYVNTARPSGGKSNETIIVSDMERKEREYMLYFPLYDGVTHLTVGIDSLAVINQPKVDLPVRTKPVVCYGTSILQGGCASRPGMAHTNILSRWFNREFINLGFSGNGQLDYEIAEIMSEVDASLFILDFVPNASVQQIEEKMERFYTILRERHPDTPVIFIEDPVFPSARLNETMHKEVEEKNKALYKVFDKLKEKGEQNIQLIPCVSMTDNEATVDGIHFTDLGFMRYAEYLYPIIKSKM